MLLYSCACSHHSGFFSLCLVFRKVWYFSCSTR